MVGISIINLSFLILSLLFIYFNLVLKAIYNSSLFLVRDIFFHLLSVLRVSLFKHRSFTVLVSELNLLDSCSLFWRTSRNIILIKLLFLKWHDSYLFIILYTLLISNICTNYCSFLSLQLLQMFYLLFLFV